MEEEPSRSGPKRPPPNSDIGIASKVKMSKLSNTPEPQNIKFSFIHQRKHTIFISGENPWAINNTTLIRQPGHTEIVIPEEIKRFAFYDLDEENALIYWKEWMNAHQSLKASNQPKKISNYIQNKLQKAGWK